MFTTPVHDSGSQAKVIMEKKATATSPHQDSTEFVKTNVSNYDEKAGECYQEVAKIGIAIADENRCVKTSLASVPWRSWLAPGWLGTQYQGKEESDVASAFSVLAHLHEFSHLRNESIDIVMEVQTTDGLVTKVGKSFVIATEVVKEGALWLPPCALNPNKIATKRETAPPTRCDS